MADLLRVHNLETYYGPIAALRGLSLTVRQGQILAVLGANGAGKSTLLKTISGVMEPQKGSIEFDGEEIRGKPPHEIARLGIAQVPEGREVFPLLSTQQNLLAGGFACQGIKRAASVETIYELFPALKEKRTAPAGYLSGGQQQMLAIGRAMMSKPRLLLLDEPSLGLSPHLIQDIARIIRHLKRDAAVTMVLVEQNARMALELGDYGYVMESGRIAMQGTSAELREATDIKEFYLGMKHRGIRGRRRWKRRKTWR